MVSMFHILQITFTVSFIPSFCQTANSYRVGESRVKRAENKEEYCKNINKLRKPSSILLIEMVCGEGVRKTRTQQQPSRRSDYHPEGLTKMRPNSGTLREEHALLNRVAHLLRKEYVHDQRQRENRNLFLNYQNGGVYDSENVRLYPIQNLARKRTEYK